MHCDRMQEICDFAFIPVSSTTDNVERGSSTTNCFDNPVDHKCREMSDQTTVTIPTEVKTKLDRIYEKNRCASTEPRWLTVNKAIKALAEKHGYDVDRETEGDDQTGREIHR